MASSTSLYYAQKDLFQFGGPILLTIGIIGSMLNLMVFTKSTLRKSPCAICFVALNIIDLLYLCMEFIPIFLQSGYDITSGQGNIVYCRFISYIGNILSSLGPSFLILASIDRILITSRKRSTRRLVIICIISLVLFWMIFHIHALIYMQILQYGLDYVICTFQPGTYTTFITCYLLIIGITAPLLMIIFGFWTMKNIHQVRHTTHPTDVSIVGATVVGRSYTPQSKDYQLIRILLTEIITYILSRFPSTIFLLYQQITQYQMKSIEQTTIEELITYITYFTGFIDSSISCYTNIFVSKTFRKELKRILLENRLIRFCRPH